MKIYLRTAETSLMEKRKRGQIQRKRKMDFMREREGVVLHLFRVGRWRSVGFPIEITTHDINSRKNESNSAHPLQCESLPRQKNRALSLPVGSLGRSELCKCSKTLKREPKQRRELPTTAHADIVPLCSRDPICD